MTTTSPRGSEAETGGLRELVQRLFPGAVLLDVRPLAPDGGGASTADDQTAKSFGYGRPLRLSILEASGRRRSLVFRTATPNPYGHDRRADRADGMILSYDTFPLVPGHVRALDVGAIGKDGRLVSLRDTGEAYLVTEWAPGALYAEDLRRVAHEGVVGPQDVDRCDALARYLLDLHASPFDAAGTAGVYTRAIRDLVGHGEGIFGIVDGYGPDVPAASPARLQAIEERCLAWRWRLKDRGHRLCRTHGDFHPFNIVFHQAVSDPIAFTLLDASRGCFGDAADDVTCLSINFVFFALEHPDAWRQGLGVLWRRFWRIYLQGSPDTQLLEAAPPFLAWRALVLANPSFYPAMTAASRERLLGFAERALDARRFDPQLAEDLFL